MSCHRFRVGLISDTHGVLRSEAVEALRGSDFIIHAGDIGHMGIIEQLAELAPVSAVRGNNDNGAWAAHLHETEVLNVGDLFIYIVHDIAQLNLGSRRGQVQCCRIGSLASTRNRRAKWSALCEPRQCWSTPLQPARLRWGACRLGSQYHAAVVHVAG